MKSRTVTQLCTSCRLFLFRVGTLLCRAGVLHGELMSVGPKPTISAHSVISSLQLWLVRVFVSDTFWSSDASSMAVHLLLSVPQH